MENILNKKNAEKGVLDLSPGTQFRVLRKNPETGRVTEGTILTRGNQRMATYRRPTDGVEVSVPLKGDEEFVLVKKKEQNVSTQAPFQLKFA